MQHEQSFGLQQQQEARLQEAARRAAESQPLNLDLLRAQIEHQRALAQKATNTPLKENLTTSQKEDIKTQAKAAQEENKISIKEAAALKKDKANVESTLGEIKRLKKLYEENKSHADDWWGPVYFDLQKKWREGGINNQAYGQTKTLQGNLIAAMAHKYSTRGLASALRMAESNKPGFDEPYESSYGKILELEKQYEAALNAIGSGLGEEKNNKLLGTKEVNGKTYYQYADGWHSEKL
jgi:hypothetical protein